MMLFIVTQEETKLYPITLVYLGYSKFLFQHSLCCRQPSFAHWFDTFSYPENIGKFNSWDIINNISLQRGNREDIIREQSLYNNLRDIRVGVSF